MSRYVSRPSEVEAIQWTGDNWGAVNEFVGDPEFIASTIDTPDHLPLQLKAGKDGAQGWVPVPLGHWIVRQPGDLTDHWPVDDDYFQLKYEPVYG